MPLFAVMGLGDATALGEKVKGMFPNDHYAVAQDKWLLFANGETAASIAEKLGMTQSVSGIVVTFGGYFGFAPADIWEWITAKTSQVRSA